MPAETSRSIALNVIAKIDGFRKEVEKMPGVTKEAASKSALAMQKQFTSEVAKQFRELDKKTEQTSSKFGALGKQIGQGLGGPIGRATSMAIEMTQKVDGAAGAVGGLSAKALFAAAAIGGTAAAVGGLIYGIKSLADRALEAEKRLIAAGRASEIPQESIVALRMYEQSSEQMNIALDKLTVSLAATFTPALAAATFALAEFVETASEKGLGAALGDAAQSVDVIAIALDKMVGVDRPWWVKSPGEVTRKFWGTVSGAVTGTADAFVDATAEAEKFRAAVEAGPFLTIAEQQANALATALRESAAAAKAATAAVKDDGELEARITQTRLDNFDLLVKKSKEDQKARAEAAEKEREQILATEATARKFRVAQIEGEKEVAKTQQENFDAAMGYVQQYAAAAVSMFQSVLGAAIAAREKDIEHEKSSLDSMRERRDDLAEQIRETDDKTTALLLQNRLDTLNEDIQAGRKRIKAHQNAARKLAIADKAAAIFGATVSTAAAVAAALPNIPLSLAVGLLGGAQIGAIIAQPLPSFFRGTSRVPDGDGRGESRMTAHKGEAVVTAGGVEGLGRMIVDSLNAGMSPLASLAGGGGGVFLDGDLVGRTVARRINGTGPLADAVHGRKPTGYRSPWGRN